MVFNLWTLFRLNDLAEDNIEYHNFYYYASFHMVTEIFSPITTMTESCSYEPVNRHLYGITSVLYRDSN